jgi:hypothetical protein
LLSAPPRHPRQPWLPPALAPIYLRKKCKRRNTLTHTHSAIYFIITPFINNPKAANFELYVSACTYTSHGDFCLGLQTYTRARRFIASTCDYLAARAGNIIFWHNATLCLFVCALAFLPVCKFLPLIDFGLLCLPAKRAFKRRLSLLAAAQIYFRCISLQPQLVLRNWIGFCFSFCATLVSIYGVRSKLNIVEFVTLNENSGKQFLMVLFVDLSKRMSIFFNL